MKEPGPEVSIILPTYNREAWLPETLDSILKQTFRDFEVIILDDGSTDKTKEIIGKINDPRIVYQQLEHSGQISYLRNKGISISRGIFIAHMDSDDLWLPDKLKEQVEVLRSIPSIGFTISNALIFDSNRILNPGYYTKFLEKYRNKIVDMFLDLYENNLKICTPAILFRKECIEKTGLMNESFDGGDYEFFTRLLFHFKGTITHKPNVHIRRHKENLSLEKGNERIDEIFYSLKYFYDQGELSFDQYERYVLRFQYFRARALTYRRKYHQSNEWLIKCMRKNPFSFKYYVRYLQNKLYSIWTLCLSTSKSKTRS